MSCAVKRQILDPCSCARFFLESYVQTTISRCHRQKTNPAATILKHFTQHADRTGNRFFILAAIFIQSIFNSLEYSTPNYLLTETDHLFSDGADIEEAIKPYLYMSKRPYWETIECEKQDEEALNKEVCSQMGIPTSFYFSMLQLTPLSR